MYDNNQFHSDFNQNPQTEKPTPKSILEDDFSNQNNGFPQNPDELNTYQKTKLPTSSLILLFVTIIATGLGIYLQLSINKINQDITNTQTAIQAQAQNIISADNQEVGLQVKKAFLDLKNAERRFFKDILQSISQDIISNSRFRIQSYSINSQGQISLNIVSTPNSINPIQDTANLIQTLKQRTYFNNAFVPGITQSLNENGLSVVQFNLQVNHNSTQNPNQSSNTTNPNQSSNTTNPNPTPTPEPATDNLRPVTPSSITE